ncbi:peptidylprolyl isomerase [Lacinutrix undariae]
MNLKLKLFAVLLSFATLGVAQTTKNDVLFTVDGDPVKANEFIRVYNKNLDLVKDESQKDIDAYLTLFVNYKLKIKEAKSLQLDEDLQYQREFRSYKKQLTQNYLADNKVTDQLVEEAYNRLAFDIDASHILVRLDANETDTIQAYNKILALRNRVLNEGYKTVQKEVHNGQTIFAEDLGYFSAFKMVYDFETVAYNTPVGEVSMPFRTRFGYHVVQVHDKRASRGEVVVKHIMVSNKQKDSLLDPEERIQQLYKKINQGESFESIATQFSDDKSSSSKGGLLAAFTGGQLSSKVFEDVAFSLNEKDEISKPFATDFGWHIIKMVKKKPFQDFETLKPELEQRVKRDSRSSLINTALAKKLKESYNVEDNDKAMAYFTSILNTNFFKKGWLLPTDLPTDETFVTIGTTALTYKDFGIHLLGSQKTYFGKHADLKSVVETEYNTFLEAELIKHREENLEFEDEEFGFILKEYRDGLLLFDLMENQIWNAGAKDTLGVQDFYNSHKTDYVWENRIDGVLISGAKKSNISKAVKLLKKGQTITDVSKKLNAKDEQKIIVTKAVMAATDTVLPSDLKLEKGVSSIYKKHDAYHAVIINEILPSGPKTFEEAKGKIISDYQNVLENSWIEALNAKYNVKVDNSVLEKVKKQILK